MTRDQFAELYFEALKDNGLYKDYKYVSETPEVVRKELLYWADYYLAKARSAWPIEVLNMLVSPKTLTNNTISSGSENL